MRDDRREVANQVAARLREMWHFPPNDNDDHAGSVRAERDGRERVAGTDRAKTAKSDVASVTETGWRAVKDLIEREEGEAVFGASAGGNVEPAGMSDEDCSLGKKIGVLVPCLFRITESTRLFLILVRKVAHGPRRRK